MKNKKILLRTLVTISLLFTAGIVYWFSPIPISEPTSKPIVKTAPQVPVSEKKARFKNIVIPAVDDVYDELRRQYQSVLLEVNSEPNSLKLVKLRKKYRVKDNQALLIALKPHPRSIAIAQAAMESSWATSRFFREANNLFGVWSFNENEPRIAAGKQRGDKTIWIKKYASVQDSVSDYYLLLARGSAFQGFRELKMKTNSPFELVKQLDLYSEKGALYGKELASIIRYNKLTEYDN